MLDTSRTDWNLSPLGKESDFSKNRHKVEKEIKAFVKKWKERDDYLVSADILKEALDEYENIKKFYSEGSNEAYYYILRSLYQDQNNSELKGKYQDIVNFANDVDNLMTFFPLKLGKITEISQKKFLSNPKLKDYKHFLKRTFDLAKHMLTEHEENLMKLKFIPSYEKWTTMVQGLLSSQEREILGDDGKKKKANYVEISETLKNRSKKIRDAAAVAFNDILVANADVAEHEINAILSNKAIDDKIRGFTRPDEDRLLGDDVPVEVVDALIEAVTKNFHISHKYYKLKAKLLKLPHLEYHERNVSYGAIKESYSYKESAEIVYEVLSNLDKEFAEIAKEFIEGGHVDVFPRKGKQSGAFSIYGLSSMPTYLLLNHTGTLDNVCTMAHEFGHGINNELIKKKQNAINFGTPKSTAEVASTFMEDFVLEKLTREASEEEKLAIMLKRVEDCVNTIIRQIACYKFEQDLHNEFRKKGYLNKEDIGKIFQKNMSAYMGPSVKQSPGSHNWWISWPHIRYFFYVYSYSSGLLISKALQAKVRKDKNFILNVKDFLSTGMSESPVEIFAKLGIDIKKKEFWEQGLKEVESLLDETERLAIKLGKVVK